VLSGPVVIVIAVLIGLPLAIATVVYLIVPLGRGVGWLVVHVSRFVWAELGDLLRLVGAMFMLGVLGVITLGNLLIARWSGAAHFGRALKGEGSTALMCLYRIAIGNPARLFMLTPLVEGFEQRLPRVVAAAPGADRPSRRLGQFDGYVIEGSLQTGGSGGKLFIARPTPEKLAALGRSGAGGIDLVVIKTFSLLDGSTLPQIVRENRALPAAKRMGLILEHELTEDRFYYVTRYVPGEPLDAVVQRLHAMSGPEGLNDASTAAVLGFATDLLRTLRDYHAGGLWHKDVKPNNIIVHGARAELVDFGLITPLRSSMTLTTHGTEYFRDPEMVRMALRGAKVHEVDGAKFDIYAAGAVMYAMIENSFPAHGGLSQVSKRCPEAVRWIARRAMAEYDKRYESAAAMLADVETVLASADVRALRPAALPSVRHARSDVSAGPDTPQGGERLEEASRSMTLESAPISSTDEFGEFHESPRRASPPGLRLTNWWSGRYSIPEQARARVMNDAAQGTRVLDRFPRGVLIAVMCLLGLVGIMGYALLLPPLIRRHYGLTGAEANASLGVVNPVPSRATRPVIVGVTGPPELTLEEAAREVRTSVVGFSEVIRRGVELGMERAREQSRGGLNDGETLTLPTPAASSSRLSPLPAGSASATDMPTLIVLRDDATFDETHAASVDSQIAALAERGYALLGNPARDEPTAKSARDGRSSLIAELRRAIGASAFASPTAGRSLRAYLDENAELRRPVLVWFGRDDRGEMSTWVLARTGAKASMVQRVVETLRSAPLEPTVPPPPAK
jgi:serine/threonine protein kinase